MTDRIADDLLVGARGITGEIGGDERRTYHLLERGLLPAFKLGGVWCARKSTLRAHVERLERAAIERLERAAAEAA
ncbi:hypothetical protein EDC65_0323 [Stella humosa]|uniref:Excisionase family DNA binding protein n=1 Tax=Stella humosa TaxID=94 RepID=A0A3N1MJ99_9PROT|nr:DNA-binding protein [Stella humosa]ROQ01146.1 hypothetical protein EDC65_0323 [Stella humosa]BBK31521.1 hypothetical protein STHU_21550 [Stella humosa]